MEDTKELVNEIQDELQSLSSSISDVVFSINKLTDPITESQKKVPLAARQLEKINTQTEEATHRMIDKTESISRVGDEIIADLEELCNAMPSEYSQQNPDIGRTLESIESKVRLNIESAEVIQNALQFQDIASQQLSYASTLIEEIEDKLRHLMSVLSGEQTPEKLLSMVQQRVFDPNADNNSAEATQENIDSLIEEYKARFDK